MGEIFDIKILDFSKSESEKPEHQVVEVEVAEARRSSEMDPKYINVNALSFIIIRKNKWAASFHDWDFQDPDIDVKAAKLIAKKQEEWVGWATVFCKISGGKIARAISIE
ncbi:hypothetical protein QJS10_CPA16g01780 [Acorus calamus]|uniref:Uncharacterized protein n=1 Tax=Acorus calamus TaxID=4465 RepID=A0AAV9D1B1_ACOCL|nr:hypothetical protein QJS10_CPA16g01780 [Acorus calamus]